jgi:type IV secretion system protein VirB1
MLAELAALALTCAPNIHPITLDALIRHESSARQYAIGVNGKGKVLPQQPKNLQDASQAAEDLIAQGIDIDAGLGQINVRNWAWLGLDSTTVFDPCRNLAAAQTVLADCYSRALRGHRREQQALRAALSCYNTGNFSRGFTNGYVDKVLAQAGIQVPALKPVPGYVGSEARTVSTTEAAAPDPATTVANNLTNPESSPGLRDDAPETTTQGIPDGFTAHPATDGFSQSAD